MLRPITNMPFLPMPIIEGPTPYNPGSGIPYKPLPKPVKPQILPPLPSLPTLPDVGGEINKAENNIIEFINKTMDGIFGEYRRFYVPILGAVVPATLILVGLMITLIVFKLF